MAVVGLGRDLDVLLPLPLPLSFFFIAGSSREQRRRAVGRVLVIGTRENFIYATTETFITGEIRRTPAATSRFEKSDDRSLVRSLARPRGLVIIS